MLLSKGIVDTWCCFLWRSLGGLEWVGGIWGLEPLVGILEKHSQEWLEMNKIFREDLHFLFGSLLFKHDETSTGGILERFNMGVIILFDHFLCWNHLLPVS